MKRYRMLGVAVGLILALGACSSPNSGAPAKVAGYAKGAITAKGSVWVNGTEFDTSSSAIKVDGLSGADTNLKIGMTVELDSSTDPITGRSTATQINYESSLKGPVGSVTATGTTSGSFAVFGQTVQVQATTVFEGTTGLAALVVGNFVEVSGQVDPATHAVMANRVEYKPASTEDSKLKGTVSALNAASGSGTFTLTLENASIFTVNYTGTLNAGIANGSSVRVEFAPSQLSGSTLTADANKIEIRTSDVHPHDGEGIELEGVVAAFDAGTFPFTLDGQLVSANATLASGLQNGSRVEVEGTMNGTTLVAAKIQIKKPETDLLEVTGQVTTIDAVGKTFAVGSLVFAASPTTIFNDKAGVWKGTNPVVAMTTSDHVVVKYFVDTTVTPAVNRAVKIERQ